MNAKKWLPILLLPIICLPAAASAQIVIDRYNEDGDPTRSVEAVTTDDEGGVKTGDESVKEEEEESKDLTSDELDEVRATLLQQLRATHSKCMKLDEIIRPDKANITGSATWEVDEKGKATFKESNSQVNMEMFFVTDREVERLKGAEKEAATTRTSQLYNDCAQGSDTKVAVKGKEATVNLSFSVTHAEKQTRVMLNDAPEEGGSVAIDL